MIDQDYIIAQLSLPRMKINGNKYNSRCIVCGDSQKSSRKARFWIRPKKSGGYSVNCFNCGYYNSLLGFVRENFPEIDLGFRSFSEQSQPKIDAGIPDFKKEIKKEVEKEKKDREQLEPSFTHESDFLLPLSWLDEDHEAIQWFNSRKIPNIWKKVLYYTDNFKQYINEKIPGKFDKVYYTDERVVIPFFTKDKKCFAVAGRSLEKDAYLRYMTIRFDNVYDADGYPKIFNLDRVDFNKRVYVFEGQIDAMFFPNSIALGGSISNLDKLLQYASKDNFVIVPDMEPWNEDTCKFIKKAIDLHYKISFFPRYFDQYGKDMNDFILNSGLTRKQLFDMVNSNISSGMKARFNYNIFKGAYS